MQTTKKWTSKGRKAQVENELFDMFSTFGDIRKVKVVRDGAGDWMAYGSVDFVSPRAASCAQILVDASEIRGKTLKVAFAKPPSKDIAKASLFVKFQPPNVDEAVVHDSKNMLSKKFGSL